MNLTLYQLTNEWRALADKLADMDMDAQTVADTIEGSDVQVAIEEKAQGYEMVARNFEAHIPAIDAEIKRLQALKKALAGRADGLRQRVLSTMQEMGIERITCPLFELRRQKNPPAVDVYDADLIPTGFYVPQPAVLDKKALAAALKAGEEIQGARLTQGESLRIK